MTISSRQQIRENLRAKSTEIKKRVQELYGVPIQDIDFSYIDTFTVLYHRIMKHDPEKPNMTDRDKLVVSNLRTIPSLLVVLADCGYLPWNDLPELLTSVPRLFTNPNVSITSYPGVDFISGSPYHGLIQSIGLGLLGSRNRAPFRVYHVLPDKRTAAIQEILLSASDSKLHNVTCMVPFLDLQRRAASMQFWFSMGWQLEEVRFDDVASIFEGCHRAGASRSKPQVLLG